MEDTSPQFSWEDKIQIFQIPKSYKYLQTWFYVTHGSKILISWKWNNIVVASHFIFSSFVDEWCICLCGCNFVSTDNFYSILLAIKIHWATLIGERLRQVTDSRRHQGNYNFFEVACTSRNWSHILCNQVRKVKMLLTLKFCSSKYYKGTVFMWNRTHN